MYYVALVSNMQLAIGQDETGLSTMRMLPKISFAKTPCEVLTNICMW